MRFSAVTVLWVIAVGALILASCGDGEEDTAPPPVAADQTAASVAEAAGLQASTPLNRVFASRVGSREVVTATRVDAADSFDDFVQLDGSPWAMDDLVMFVGLEELFEVVYADTADTALRIAVIEVARLESEEGARRLLDIIRDQPAEEGRVRVDVPAGFDPQRALAVQYDFKPAAVGVAASVGDGLRASSLVTVEGNLLLRVIVIGEGGAALEETGELTRRQVERFAAARAGELSPALDLPFPVPTPEALTALLPEEMAGLARVSQETDEDGATAQYVGSGGEIIVVLMRIVQDAGEGLILDYLVGQPGFLAEAFAESDSPVDVLSAEPLAAVLPDARAVVAERWLIEVEGLELFDDVVAFRRGSVWGVAQGLSPDPGGTPLTAFLTDLVDAIQRTLEGAE